MTMVTRKPVGGHPPAPSSIPSPPGPVPGTPTIIAPTPTSAPSSPPIARQAPPVAPPPPPPPPPPAIDVPSTANATTTRSSNERPIDAASDSDDDEWDKSDTSEDEWDLADDDDRKMTPDEIPAPLRISRPTSQELDKGKGKEQAIPAALRAGPPGGIPQHSNESLPIGSMDSNNPWRSASHSPPRDAAQNPFLRPQNTGEALFGSQNSSAVWSGASSPQPAGVVAELPSTTSPTQGVANLAISELPGVSSPVEKRAHPLLPAGLEAPSEQRPVSMSDPFGPIPAEGLVGTQKAWQDEPASSSSQSQYQTVPETRQMENAVEQQVQIPSKTGSLLDGFEEEPAPALPPRTNTNELENAPPKPPRPQIDVNAAVAAAADVHDTRSTAESPATVMKKQRNQTYQIKKVRWFDDRVRDMRVSPILIQNANGPCPLLALVNALTLSTQRDVNTGLVEALRTREQVSLGLLLDAVFEELMSGRRGDSAQELPDVGELYSFLIALHTGMNVNPQFTRKDDAPHPRQPGSFELTKEMRLYGTFSVPLIHGWIPEPNSEAYNAFERSAKTYEDAQNIQFYEEELEAKLSSSGLNVEEQHMFEDLVSIKQFLATWPTQLTEYGLNVIRDHLQSGQFAILFRNDHFSTVYKEPRSGSLLTVVTDAGYASHDEIVWESLVDINGMRTEHFSGDFRPVSHNATTASSSSAGPPTVGPRNASLGGQHIQSMLDVDQGWTQVQGKKGKRVKGSDTDGQSSGIIHASTSTGPRAEASISAQGMSQAEQEDADLALALQLQEEEEERQRREQSDRRNRQLSSQVLDQSTPPTSIRPLIPPRRQGPQFTTNRPVSTTDEAPPPSYEDASKDRRFNPPRDHPASPHAPIGGSSSSPGGGGATSGHRRESSAYAQASSSRPGGNMSTNDLPATGRRTSRPNAPPGGLVNQIPNQPRPYRQGGGRLSGPMSPVGSGMSREEKCIVM